MENSLPYKTSFKELVERVRFVVLVLILISLPFVTVLNSALIITFAVLTIILVFVGGYVSPNKFDRKVLMVFSSLFVLYVLWILIGFQWSQSFHIEKKFALIIFPLAFCFTRTVSRKEFNIALLAFLVSVIIALLMAVVKHNDLLTGAAIDVDIDSYLVMRRPYMGFYLTTAALVSAYFVITVRDLRIRIVSLIITAILLYGTILIYTKMALLSFFVAVFITSITWLLIKRKYKTTLALAACVVVGLIGVVIISEQTRTILFKVMSGESFDFTQYNWNYFLSLNIRNAIWSCCWDLINTGNNWITGAGLNHQTYLDQCYNDPQLWAKYGVDPTYLDLGSSMFNAHNEYFTMWLDFGIVGLLALIACFVTGFVTAVRKRNFLYLAFVILFFGCCVTETMLGVQRGIVLFAFLNSFFAFASPQLETTDRSAVG